MLGTEPHKTTTKWMETLAGDIVAVHGHMKWLFISGINLKIDYLYLAKKGEKIIFF